MPETAAAPPVKVELEGPVAVGALPEDAVVLTPPLPGATGMPVPAVAGLAPAAAAAVAVDTPEPVGDAAAAIAEREESAETTMGPEPAMEVTPLSAEAI